MRYIYSGATKTIQYVFISVGLAATVIRLAMMSYVLLRKFLLWRSGAKDQGLYPIFFSYFYPGKWSSGCRWVQENFTIENFSLTCRSIALFIWREREKKKSLWPLRKYLWERHWYYYFYLLSFSGSGDDENMLAENIGSDWVQAAWSSLFV